MMPHNGSESDKNYNRNVMLLYSLHFGYMLRTTNITYPSVCAAGIYKYTIIQLWHTLADIKTHEFVSIKLLIAIKSPIYYRRVRTHITFRQCCVCMYSLRSSLYKLFQFSWSAFRMDVSYTLLAFTYVNLVGKSTFKRCTHKKVKWYLARNAIFRDSYVHEMHLLIFFKEKLFERKSESSLRIMSQTTSW